MESPKLQISIPNDSTFNFSWPTVNKSEPNHEKGRPNEISMKQNENPKPRLLEPIKKHIETQAPNMIAMHLLHQSWSVFKHLRLGDWVKHVMGMPCTPFHIFELFHSNVYHSIFSHLEECPHDLSLFEEAAKMIEAIDPFLHFTVTQTFSAYEKRQLSLHPEMQSDLIAEPLQKLLSGRGDSIIQRLKILKSRYTRYKTSEDLGFKRVFDTSTDFFSALGSKGAKALALEMTNRAFESFEQLSLDGLRLYDEHIRDLAVQWDKLNRDVEDVVSAGRGYDKLLSVALELHRIRNHFCLSAIVNGLIQGHCRVDQMFDALIDPHENYRRYRLEIHSHPSIPFLYPLIIELRRGNRKVLKDIFSFVAYDEFLQGIENKLSADL